MGEPDKVVRGKLNGKNTLRARAVMTSGKYIIKVRAPQFEGQREVAIKFEAFPVV